MQFLHTVHYIIFGNFYNKHWNWYLSCLFSLVFKKIWCLCYAWYPYWTTIYWPYKWNKRVLFFWRHDWYKNFQSNLLKIDKKLHKDIDIYYIGYVTIEKFSYCENIHSVNPFYVIIDSATGYFKEKNGEKYLILLFDR